jgi:hypothetical protein
MKEKTRLEHLKIRRPESKVAIPLWARPIVFLIWPFLAVFIVTVVAVALTLAWPVTLTPWFKITLKSK